MNALERIARGAIEVDIHGEPVVTNVQKILEELEFWKRRHEVNQIFELTTTATTADQSIGSYTPPQGQTLVITAIFIEVTLTTISTTQVHMGTLKIRETTTDKSPAFQASNPSSAAPFGFMVPTPGWEIKGDGSKTLNAVCTPAAVTSTKWKVWIIAHLKGVYEGLKWIE